MYTTGVQSMRLNRTEIDKRYPSEENLLELMDALTLLDANYREMQRLLSGRQWRALADKLSHVQAEARKAEFTINRILWPEQKVIE